MSSFDMIITTINEQKTYIESFENRTFPSFPDNARKIHDCIYNYIIKRAVSPENILDLLKTINELYIPEIHRIEDLVGITCLEGLTVRRPPVLEGIWEELLFYIMLNYISCLYDTEFLEYETSGILRLDPIRKLIPEYCSLQLCPNPFLRIELFNFMDRCGIEDSESSKEYFISTLFELEDKVDHCEENKFSNFGPDDLFYFVVRYSLDITTLMNSVTRAKRDKIIKAVVKFTNIFVSREDLKDVDDFIEHINDYYLNFCGLIPTLATDCDMKNFAEAVKRDNLVQEYVADVFNSISIQFSNMYRDERVKAVPRRNRILSALVSAEAGLVSSRLPLSLCDREINGTTPQIIHQMLYFTNIMNSEETNSDDLESSNTSYSSEEESDW